MNTISSKKPLIISVIVFLIAGIAYFYFSGSPKDADTSLKSVSETSDAALKGAKVLTLLNQISALSIDTKIFDGLVYKSLVDHTVKVVEQNVGKSNPFASFSSVSSSVNIFSGASTSTPIIKAKKTK